MFSEETVQKTQTQENDVCEACGTIVELGSVIREDDTQLVLPFSGPTKESVEALADKYIKAAKARFNTVDITVDYKEVESMVDPHFHKICTFLAVITNFISCFSA